ncbi:nonribosomal peptide synthetase MxaA [Methylocaldum sp. MU1018]
MKQTSLVFLLFFFGTATAATPELPGPVRDFQVLTPRPFGYAIGDIVRQTLVVAIDREASLDRNSLPRSRINRWLELREAQVRESERDGLRHYSIELDYQTFYAPLEVKNLAIPAFKLAFTRADGVFELEVPAWSFTMAPIRELSILREEGLEPMRPDAPPALPDRSGPRRGLAVAAAVGGGAGSYLAYLYGYLPWQRRGRHFRSACRTVRALSRAPGAPDYSAVYAAIHRAFNGVYGQPLFSQRLDAFFTERPAYAPLREEITAFFENSYELFFTERPKEAGFSISRLLRLCRDCYDIERSLR